MGLRIADDAVVRCPLADLELRLDEGDDRRRARPKRRGDRTEDQSERDERHVDDRKVDRLAEGTRVEGTDVRAIVDDDPRIARDPVGELAAAHVDGMDAPGATLQEDVREAAGGRTRVEADPAFRINLEGIKRGRELVAAPTDVRVDGLERDRQVRVDEIPGLAIRADGIADPRPDLARQDQGLGPRSAFRQTALHDELIEPLPRSTGGGVAHAAIVAQPPSRRLIADRIAGGRPLRLGDRNRPGPRPSVLHQRRLPHEDSMTTRPWTLIVAAALLLLIGGSGMAAGGSLLGVAINGSMTEDVRGAGLRIGMGIATYGFAAVVAGVGLVLVRRWAWRLGVLLVIVGLVGLVGPLVALGQVDPILASGVVIWGVAFACLISPRTQRAIRR
jgi:hypothetical protein